MDCFINKRQRIRLPKNKFARLGIYIFIIAFWYFLSTFLLGLLVSWLIDGDYQDAELVADIWIIIGVCLMIGPFVFTKIIWFPKRPRIPRSKD